MNKRGKIMVGGAIVLSIGIIIIIFGYDKFKSMEGVVTTLVNGAPPGAIETTIGILVAALGMFVLIHGFGLLPEETKVQ